MRKHLVDAKYICSLLNIKESKSYELMNEEDFPLIKIGENKRVYEDELRNWIDSTKNNITYTPHQIIRKQDMMYSNTHFLTVKEAEEITGLSRSKLYMLSLLESTPFFRIKGLVRISERELYAWIEKHRVSNSVQKNRKLV